jgi:hypothetical protein
VRPGVCDKRKQTLGEKGKAAFSYSVTGVVCESYGHLYGLDEYGQYDGVVVALAALPRRRMGMDLWGDTITTTYQESGFSP